MTDVVYSVGIHDAEILTALQRIDKKFSDIAKDGSQAFEKVEKSAKQSGVAIGVTAGIVTELTRRVIDLSVKAVSAIADITKESVKLASELETTRNIFEGILGGNPEAAIAALDHINKQSRDLGINLAETSRAFLPFVSNLKELDRVNKISAALAISQPEQGEQGARIALQEALSGNVQSLVRRFEIPKSLGKELQRALDEGGVAEFLDTFETIMKRLGRDVENLTDTFQFSFGRAQESLRQLQTSFGVPVTDELKNQFDDLNDTIKTNFDDYTVIANTFGRAMANLVDIIGTGLNDFLKNLDNEKVIEIGEEFFDITEDARVFIELLSNATFPEGLTNGILDFLGFLDEALIKFNMLVGESKAQSARAAAETKALQDQLLEKGAKEGNQGLASFAAGALEYIPGLTALNSQLVELVGNEEAQTFAANAAAAGDKAYQEEISKVTRALDESKKRREENRKATDDFTESLGKNNEALADQELALNKANADLGELEDAFEDASAKVDKAKQEVALDNQRKLEDIDIQTERKRLDIAIEFGQKREDAAVDNLRKLDDIQEKYNDDVEDAATDLERKRQDIATKYYRDYIDIEREQRQKRVDIEKDFNRQIKDIQQQFLLDAQEAEEKRDAVAFIRALKERDKKVQDAQLDRQRTIRDARQTADEKRHELIIQYQREEEDAQLAYDRQLEDLKTNLDRQREEQNENYNQQLADIGIAEARKNEELNLWREREIEDAKLAYDRKLEDLKTSLADELAIIEEFGQKKLELMQQIANAQSAIAAQSVSAQNTVTGAGSQSGSSYYSSRQGGINNQRQQSTYASSRQGGINSVRQGRASGGNVFAGGTYPVGERGMELFTPNQNGRIIPNSALTMPNFGGSSAIHNVTTNNNQSASLGGLLDPNSLDAILSAKVQNMLLGILDKMG